MTDAQIVKEIMDHLAWDNRVDASDIQVEVINGRVRLSGTVPNQGARKAAQDAAQHTMGVVEVYNQLELGT
ncbi:MAG: BON domain-containing protein [Thermodesulfobacteriota bacterium]